MLLPLSRTDEIGVTRNRAVQPDIRSASRVLLTRAARTTGRGVPTACWTVTLQQSTRWEQDPGPEGGGWSPCGRGCDGEGAPDGGAGGSRTAGRSGGLFLTCRASTPSALLFSLTRATQGFAELGLASLRLRVTVTGTFLHSLGRNRLSYRRSFHFATEQVFFFSF